MLIRLLVNQKPELSLSDSGISFGTHYCYQQCLCQKAKNTYKKVVLPANVSLQHPTPPTKKQNKIKTGIRIRVISSTLKETIYTF